MAKDIAENQYKRIDHVNTYQDLIPAHCSASVETINKNLLSLELFILNEFAS